MIAAERSTLYRINSVVSPPPPPLVSLSNGDSVAHSSPPSQTPRKSGARNGSAASLGRRIRWSFALIATVALVTFFSRAFYLHRRIAGNRDDSGWAPRDDDDDALSADDALRWRKSVDEDVALVLEYLNPDLLSTDNSSNLLASQRVFRSSASEVSDRLTLVIPLRGQILPLGHITSPWLCSRGGDSSPPTPAVDVIFPTTTRLKLELAMEVLPGRWEEHPGFATPIRLSKFVVTRVYVVHASHVDSRIVLSPCIASVAIVFVQSLENGVESTFDSFERILGELARATDKDGRGNVSAKSSSSQTAGEQQGATGPLTGSKTQRSRATDGGPGNVQLSSSSSSSSRPETNVLANDMIRATREVVPLNQLILAALRISRREASHFAVLAQNVFPVDLRTAAQQPLTSGREASDAERSAPMPHLLDGLMQPFRVPQTNGASRGRRTTAGGSSSGRVAADAATNDEIDDVVAVASQCLLLQPAPWTVSSDAWLAPEEREAGISTAWLQQEDFAGANSSSSSSDAGRYRVSGAPPTEQKGKQPQTGKKAKKGAAAQVGGGRVAIPTTLLRLERLQPDASARLQWSQLGLSAVPHNTVTVVDKGIESAFGVDRQYTVPYSVRRLHGFPPTDRRTRSVDTVDMVSPYCSAFDRNKFLAAGGLRNDVSATFTNRIFAGIFSEQTRKRILTLVKVRITFVERVMESISLPDVHRAGNVLRQQVRLAYTEVVESSHLWEDVTGKKFDRSLRRSGFADAVVLAEQAAQDEAFASLESIDKKLAWQSSRLHEAAKELLKLGKNKDSTATEEALGWDLSLRLQRNNRQWRVFATGAPAMMLRAWMPQELVLYFRTTKMPVVYPSYLVDGSLQDQWGKALLAMHRSRGGLLQSEWISMAKREAQLKNRPLTVFWSSFCCGCCGFSSEIVHFVYPLSRRRNVYLFNDAGCFCRGYPGAIQDSLQRMLMSPENYLVRYHDPDETTVWISHTDPNSYQQVITEKRKPSYFVGRSMYEFTKIPETWVKAIHSYADEVWVPSTFVRHVFVSNGVRPDKVVVVPEAIDTYFFDPVAHQPLALPLQRHYPQWRVWENRPLDNEEDYQSSYKFYSNFKWEPRKGWELLLQAYYDAFAAPRRDPSSAQPFSSPPPKVSLYIQTFFFLNAAVPKGFDVRNVSHILKQIESWISSSPSFPNGTTLQDHFPHIVFVTEHLTEREQVELYRTMDAFVLPTRGEGWGLPTIQAMAMGLPTISTNWGGNTDFMSPESSLLIPVDGLEELPEDSMYKHDVGKKWALPNLAATTRLMRWCFENPAAARKLGTRARLDIGRRFSEEAVVELVDARLEAIRRIVASRE